MKSIFFALCITLLTLQSCQATGFLKSEALVLQQASDQVNFTQVIDEINNPNKTPTSFLVVDIRAPADYAPVHIIDAVNIPNADIQADPTTVGNLTYIYDRGKTKSIC